jgi:hypothetical protein
MSKNNSKQRTKQRKKVPIPIKVGITVIGTFFILMAVVGVLAHGQYNMTNPTTIAPASSTSGIPESAKGCIGNDQATGKTYIDVRCLQDPQLNQIMCDNWPGPGNNATCPNTTVPHNIASMNMTNSTR